VTARHHPDPAVAPGGDDERRLAERLAAREDAALEQAYEPVRSLASPSGLIRV